MWFTTALLSLNFYSPSLPQSCLAWVLPSTQLHSGLAPSTHRCNNLLGRRPASSQTLLHRRRSSVFLGVTGTDMTTKPIAASNQPNQLSSRQLCDSAIASVFSVCLLFCCNTLTSRDVESVLTASVDYNKHRLKCLTYHDVCGMMGDHIQSEYCYMIIQVCSTCLYTNILKASSILVVGFHNAAFY